MLLTINHQILFNDIKNFSIPSNISSIFSSIHFLSDVWIFLLNISLLNVIIILLWTSTISDSRICLFLKIYVFKHNSNFSTNGYRNKIVSSIFKASNDIINLEHSSQLMNSDEFRNAADDIESEEND